MYHKVLRNNQNYQLPTQKKDVLPTACTHSTQKNILTKFHKDWMKTVTSIVYTRFNPDFFKTNILTKFHEDWMKTVTSNVYTSDLTNILTKFHEDWMKTVTSIVYTREASDLNGNCLTLKRTGKLLT
ncbi:hypothetical protein DPMN_005100 [Dreissena polymorpha]|uniref:Uncharacterized protein n=1 Tax=Dreissena polymorpha TaxID=45954 RepID=A0A9D4RWI0_DREPO|nr:hypothetical protein DPMN_005100 [Dreissena polymorpha]